MAAGYIPLPAAKYPTNATLDFSPLSQGIDSARQWSQQQHSAMLNDKADVRADEDQKLQRAKFGMQQTQFNDEQQEKIKQRYARAFQVVDTMPEGPDRAAAHERLLKSYPGGGANLDPMYRDPIMGPKRILAEAGMFKDPIEAQQNALKSDLMRSQIDENKAQAANAGRPKLPPGMQWDPSNPSRAMPIPGITAPRAKVPSSTQAAALSIDAAYNTLIPALDDYETLITGKTGPDGKKLPGQKGTGASYVSGKDADSINSARTNIQLQLKELYNLGVLNGPDLGLMENMLFDPSVSLTSPSTWWRDVDGRTRSSVEQLKTKLLNIRNQKVAGANMPPIGPSVRPGAGGGVPPQQKFTGGQPLQTHSAPPVEAIQELAADPSPEAIREFEEAFGVSALDYIGQQ